MEEKIEILLATIDVNLMLYREIGTIGYRNRAIEAFKTIEEIIANENEITQEYNILEFKKVA